MSYRNTGYMLYNGFKVTQKTKQEYAIKLKEFIDGDKPLIYVDESSFNTWKKMNKTWAPKHNIIHLPLQNTRRKGVTVYGAIGACLRKAVFIGGETTCTDGFISLLKKVRKNFIGGREETIYMVADGASAHRSNIALNYMAENHIVYLQTPPYSPAFNSIERLWHHLKRTVVNMLLEFGKDATDADFYKIVHDATQTVDYDK